MIALLPLILFVFFYSCQKELNDGKDPNSKGVLIKDSVGNCALITIAGNYVAGRALNDSNKLTVTVNVTVVGDYTIRTDSSNGYSFKAVGHFTALGRQVVQLVGNGKPVSASTNHFNVYYDTSICQVNVLVRPAVPLATYTLSGAPNGCTNATLYGASTKGISFDSSAYASITVNVATVGSYSITTNTINNYSFIGSGIFTATGVQSVRLYTSGMPANAGTDTFAVTANNSTCHFTVPVLVPVDYFPLTANSYWVYDNLFVPTDSIVRTIVGASSMGGNSYTVMREQIVYRTQQLLFRKSGFDYLDYGQVTRYTTSFMYKNAIVASINFF